MIFPKDCIRDVKVLLAFLSLPDDIIAEMAEVTRLCDRCSVKLGDDENASWIFWMLFKLKTSKM